MFGLVRCFRMVRDPPSLLLFYFLFSTLLEQSRTQGNETIYLTALRELEIQNSLIAQSIREYKPPLAEPIGFRKFVETEEVDPNASEVLDDSVEGDVGGEGELFDFDDDDA
jgi:hypothetical protein